MDEPTFWKVIEQSKEGCELFDGDKQTEQLRELLRPLNPEEIESFKRIFSRKRDEAYRWDLWAVGYIVQHGCSDSGFEYFREWVISQGEGFFNAAMTNPNLIFDSVDVEATLQTPFESELFQAAGEVYQAKTGKDLHVFTPYSDLTCGGEDWDEYDLVTRYPDACWKFRFFAEREMDELFSAIRDKHKSPSVPYTAFASVIQFEKTSGYRLPRDVSYFYQTFENGVSLSTSNTVVTPIEKLRSAAEYLQSNQFPKNRFVLGMQGEGLVIGIDLVGADVPHPVFTFDAKSGTTKVTYSSFQKFLWDMMA